VQGEELHHLQDMLSNRLYRLMHVTAGQLEGHLQTSRSYHNLAALAGQGSAVDGAKPQLAAAPPAGATATAQDHSDGLSSIKEAHAASATQPAGAASVTGPSLGTTSVPGAVRQRLNYTHTLRRASVQATANPWAAAQPGDGALRLP
jgi:hypothetical protein